MFKKKKSFSKTNIIITILVFVIIISMGTGYAVLSQVLDINGSTFLDIPDYRIYISDVKVISTTGEGYTTTSPTFDDSSVALYTQLPSMDSSVTYEITLKNVGESNAILDYLYTYTTNSWAKFEVDGINATEKVSKLSVKKIRVTVSPSEHSSDVLAKESYIMLNFAFIKDAGNYSNACTLQWDGSSSSEPVKTNILGREYYQIGNANEFKWFMDQVNSGNVNISAMLTNNICLNDKTISPIASEENPYAGIFDGQNRHISGISFSRDVEIKSSNTTYNVGLFMKNVGYIKNLHVTAKYYDKQYVSTRKSNLYLGGIAVYNKGFMENLTFNGSIELDAEAHVNCTARAAHTINYIGGIAAYNTGVIRGSYNNATFKLTGSTTSSACNIHERSSRIYAGGIASLNSGAIGNSYNKATMDIHCYNAHSTNTTNISEIGGVVSNNWVIEDDGYTFTGFIENSYNIGTINWTRDGTGSFDRLTETVAVNDGGTLRNIYLLSGSAENPEGNYLAKVVSANDLMNLNGEVSLGKGFKKDTLNLNGGYPVLYWERN